MIISVVSQGRTWIMSSFRGCSVYHVRTHSSFQMTSEVRLAVTLSLMMLTDTD